MMAITDFGKISLIKRGQRNIIDINIINIYLNVWQVGIPEVDLQTIDNLGRTLIDVAR